MKGYYQPAGLVGWVNWAWILMIALFSLIMQLEVTAFNVWTAVSLAAFLLITVVTIMRRRIILNDDETEIRMTQFGSVHTDLLPVAELAHVQFTKHGMLFSHDGEMYNVLVSKKMRMRLKEIFED
jgi:heme exporter protein D